MTTPEELLSQARDALAPFAAMALHYPAAGRGNRPRSGTIHAVSSGGMDDAEITVEHLRAAESFIAAIDAHLKQPSAPSGEPLRRGSTGACSRKHCECEREGLGDQCIWLRPTDAELQRRTGEPHIDGWPLYSGLPPPVKPAPQAAPAPQAQADAWRRLYRLAINEANGLTNYVEDRPELRRAEKRLEAIQSEARAVESANGITATTAKG